MSTSNIPLKRITLYKNDLGYFERTISADQTPAVLRVAKKNKKLVIDTLCTTASAVTFDTEEHDKYVAGSNVEQFYTFTDLSSSSSFSTFLKACIGAEVVLCVKDNKTEQIGKLVMLDETKITRGSDDSEEEKIKYTLEVLNKDGFIRQYDRKRIIYKKNN